jgi:hypothetical protein
VAMSACPRISKDQYRALRLLANGAHGCTESMMLAHGFKAELLAALARDGLATTQLGTIRAGGRQLEVVWVMITDAGHRLSPDNAARWGRPRRHPQSRVGKDGANPKSMPARGQCAVRAHDGKLHDRAAQHGL